MIKDAVIVGGVTGEFSVMVIDAKTGDVLERFSEKNLVVTLGHTNLAKLLGGDAAGKKIDKIGVGTNGTAPVIVDTVLTDPFTKAITDAIFPEANSVKFNWAIGADEANGKTIREFGLLNVDGILCARKVRTEIVKSDAVRLVGSWKITFNS